MPPTLAETIRITDSYALGDPMQPLLNSVELSRRDRYPDNNGPRRGDHQDSQNKRREDRPDYRYGSNQVVIVAQDQPDASNNQHQKTNAGPALGQNQDGARQWNNQRKP